MTTLLLEQVPQAELDDPFPYGWREIERTMPNGLEVNERIPLTLEDILHPEIGDFRMHTKAHEDICTYLKNVFSGQLKHDPNALVFHDNRLAWDDPVIRPHGPDIAVIFNVLNKKNWSTFYCAEEQTKPEVIVEVTSPKTRDVDLVTKLDQYEQVGLPYYIIIDIYHKAGQEFRRLLGYEMTEHGFAVMVPNSLERLWIEPLQLFIGLDDTDEVVCYDIEGNALADYVGVLDERDFAWRQAKAEHERAEAERKRAEAEHKRAEVAQRNAQEERERAESAETQLSDLQAELERLREQLSKR